ncbi:hypothetical protein [Oxalicibacterium faecigallinarum]|uniref:hypothetical protein n=1 Tax=Oxalicibacterium faecigallinarum TaxID=573741 RepID=UPI00280A93A5|nr:hypothetical protein [Oxalicibacterium faecigallinarum]
MTNICTIIGTPAHLPGPKQVAPLYRRNHVPDDCSGSQSPFLQDGNHPASMLRTAIDELQQGKQSSHKEAKDRQEQQEPPTSPRVEKQKSMTVYQEA